MEIIRASGENAVVELSRDELVLLANAINESREAIEEWEFSTRMGAEVVEANQLMEELTRLLSSMK